jgi:hypothetical protein
MVEQQGVQMGEDGVENDIPNANCELNTEHTG